MMEIVRINADDQNVAVRKAYTKSSDTFAYADSKCTVKIKADELRDAFIKGMIIVDAAGVEYKPISCKVASEVATVTYVTTDSTTATTAKLATIKSE